MLWNLAGHWFIGLPLGYTLCFVVGLGVIGLWWGLSTGLIICGIALLVVWCSFMPATLAHHRGAARRFRLLRSASAEEA